jgi:hypothetical protein
MAATTKTERRRGFELAVTSEQRRDGRYAVTLVETNGRPENRREVARVAPERLDAAQPALADALRTSGHPRTALKATRKTPLLLEEESGVRAALALAVINGVTKPGRTTRLLDGMARLSNEECFYWYAHTLGTADTTVGRRRLKALRIFLAQE